MRTSAIHVASPLRQCPNSTFLRAASEEETPHRLRMHRSQFTNAFAWSLRLLVQRNRPTSTLRLFQPILLARVSARGSEARGHCRHWCRLRVRILPRHSIPAKAEATLHHSLRRGKSRSLSTQRRRQVVYALQFGCGRSQRPDLLFRQPGIHKRADGLRLHRARYGRTPRG